MDGLVDLAPEITDFVHVTVALTLHDVQFLKQPKTSTRMLR